MTSLPLTSTLGLTPEQHARVIDQAKQEAARLRREAIDAFLGSLARAARSAMRSLSHAVWARRRTPIRSVQG